MKKILLALMIVSGMGVAQAQVTGNIGATSDYRFRGIARRKNQRLFKVALIMPTRVVYMLVTGTAMSVARCIPTALD